VVPRYILQRAGAKKGAAEIYLMGRLQPFMSCRCKWRNCHPCPGWEESPQAYREVLQTSGEDPLFLNLDWLSAWWKAFGEGKSQLILQVTEHDQPVGYAALTLSSRGRTHWTKAEFMGVGPSDRCGIVARDGRADVHEAIWEHLRERDDWDVLELRDMRSGGPTEQNVRSMFPHAEKAGIMAPAIALGGSYEEYIASLSSKMRSTLRRGWRRLQDEGAEFRSLRTADDAQEAVEWLGELNDQRWQSSSCLQTSGMIDFIKDVSARLAGQGVVFHALLVKNEPTAIAMGLEDRDRYLYYLTGFGPELERYSPGAVLLNRIIEECHQLGRSEVDMLRGAEAYKYRFNAVDRPQVHIRAVNKGLVRRTQYSLREAPLI